jgi:hypothetical protein
LPEAIVRRPNSFALLDVAVAVAAEAIDVSKYLLEFLAAKPTRETLKMAISIDSLELIRLIWARLPGEQHWRHDLLEVAADFHREEPLRWLWRDSTVFEHELLFVFALEAHLTDGILVVLCEGVLPWWHRTHEVAVKWRAAEGIEFGEPPVGFYARGGWWEDASGAVWPNTVQSNEGWGRLVTESKLVPGEKVVAVVLPSGVSSISCGAFQDQCALRSLMIQPGCVKVEDGQLKWSGRVRSIKGAMCGCRSLVKVTIQDTCTSIGNYAFWGCSSLLYLTIPMNVTRIGDSALAGVRG